mmetsp:Transcript_16973/g.28309  ORF Transcript_16973/g.28309 Transcript_16973/m.28309 type:complete len:233 (+) Transcript_16973:23-721(+)|eukprot:CAMPEP_0119329842 /NCGR_PEP_ID=MMETSP1333-20130426/76851_1 /TAXON_ID=418940 /ORGANISM="Scyphosphaera apsteinii, Strain RCC1455" /LENGTH=232 /DNA_ID=CAMNT_0007339069 /DNA_START=18 /DNA_END=716 /DNA_ORIENTATION=+
MPGLVVMSVAFSASWQPGLIGPLRAVSVVRSSSSSCVTTSDQDASFVLPSVLRPPGPTPELPLLTDSDIQKLAEGVRVQRQLLTGDVGGGFAVQDICASPGSVWRYVRDFDNYDSLIGTVRSATPYEPKVQVEGTFCYNFLVSRIRLQLNVRWCVNDDLRYASWTLERPSWVLLDSCGFWHVQPLPERPGFVRVWFCASVRLKQQVPGFVIRLVSRLGLAKACSWVSSMAYE